MTNLPYDTFKDFAEIAPLAALYQALVIAPTGELRDQFRNLAAEPLNMTRTEFARFVRSEARSAVRVAKAAGIKLTN